VKLFRGFISVKGAKTAHLIALMLEQWRAFATMCKICYMISFQISNVDPHCLRYGVEREWANKTLFSWWGWLENFVKNYFKFVCFVPSLPSCHEKATVALYFGRAICNRLGVVHFQIFRCCFDFFSVNLLLVQSLQAKLIIEKYLMQSHNNSVNSLMMVGIEPKSYDYD